MVKTINSNKMKQLWDNACHKENDYTGCGHFFSTTRISKLKGDKFKQLKQKIQNIEKYIGTELLYSCTKDVFEHKEGKRLYFLFDRHKTEIDRTIISNLISNILIAYTDNTEFINARAVSKKALKRAEDLDVDSSSNCAGSPTTCPLF